MPAQTLQVSKQTLLRAMASVQGRLIWLLMTIDECRKSLGLKKCCRGRSHSRGICYPADHFSFEARFRTPSFASAFCPRLDLKAVSRVCFQAKAQLIFETLQQVVLLRPLLDRSDDLFWLLHH